MTSVKSTEIQKSFGKWLDKTHEGPIAITKYDRPAAFLISARDYEDLRSNYRKAITAGQLTEQEIELLRNSQVATDQPFNLEDIPDAEAEPPLRRKRRA